MPRLFIAFDIPGDMKRSLAEATRWMEEYQSHVKVVVPENYHITLKFLGPTSAEKIEPIKAALSRVALSRRPFLACLGAWGVFPEAKRAKVFWIGVEPAQSIMNIAGDIETALEALGFAMEPRDLKCHITLCRSIASRVPESFLGRWESLAPISDLSFTLSAIKLYESVTHATGPRYTPLCSFGMHA